MEKDVTFELQQKIEDDWVGLLHVEVRMSSSMHAKFLEKAGPMEGNFVKQGWVQHIYKYLLEFYPCSSSSCTYAWSASCMRVKCVENNHFLPRFIK